MMVAATIMFLAALLFALMWIFLFVKVLRKLLSIRVSPFPGAGRFLNSKLRLRLWSVETLAMRSGISRGMRILDAGCGRGLVTRHLADIVGQTGAVYALDISRGQLEHLNEGMRNDVANVGAKTAPRRNVYMIQGDMVKLPIASDSIDAVLVVAALQEFSDRNAALREIRRVVRPGGIVAVSEFVVDPDFPFVATTVHTVREHGFELEDRQGGLWQYTVRFRKPSVPSIA